MQHVWNEYDFSSVSWLTWLELLDHANMLTSSICWISINFSCVFGLTWLELLDHTSMSTSSMSWSSMTRSCVSTSLTWLTWLHVFLEWRGLPYLTWLIWLESFDLTWLYLIYIHLWKRICDGESPSGTPSSGVIRNGLLENRWIFLGCSIRLRCHGPFISCHVLLPRCFALSGTRLGSIFFLWCWFSGTWSSSNPEKYWIYPGQCLFWSQYKKG